MATSKQLQQFTFATVKRSSIAPFECNPRTIDRSAARKLRENIKKFGLVQPLVVNRRTAANGFAPEQVGSLVLLGGHQRLSAADNLAGYDSTSAPLPLHTCDGNGNPLPEIIFANDYDVPVAISEVTSAAEKTLVIALNNPSLQGNWDSELLERLITDPEVAENITDTGFDRASLGLMFDSFIADGLFGKQAAEQVNLEAPIISVLEEIRQAGKAAKDSGVATKTADGNFNVLPGPVDAATILSEARKAAGSSELSPTRISTTDYTATAADDARIAAEREAEREARGLPASQESFHARTPEEILAAERERKIAERQKYIDKAAFDRDASFMVTIVAETSGELAEWLEGIGLSLPENKMISLADLREAIDFTNEQLGIDRGE